MTIDVSTKHTPQFITSHIQNMILEMSGGQNSFLKQLCTTLQNEQQICDEEKLTPLVRLIDHLLEASSNSLKERWTGLLHSFSNQQVFQAIAELISVGHLMKVGWTTEEWTDDLITVRHENGKTARLLVLSFILQRDLDTEKRIQNELVAAINGIETPHKIAITIRKPLNHQLDILEATKMVRFWLEDVQENRKSSHSGYIRDDYNWFDIRYLGSKTDDENVVDICLPPLIGRQMYNIITKTADKAVEKVRRSGDKTPVILSIVTNQPTQISSRGWQFLLYGQPQYQSDTTCTLDGTQFGGWLQDPFRTGIVGVLRLEQSIASSPNFDHASYSNPWSEHRRFDELLPAPRVYVSSAETPYLNIHLAG